MKSKILLILICLNIFLINCSQQEKTCLIKGKVINRPQSRQLRLTKAFVDFRSQSAVIIPIKDSIFNYKLNFKDIEAYNLVFGDEYIQGNMRLITFFPTNGIIEMELYPMQEFKRNIVSGGKDNNEFIKYHKKKIDVLEQMDENQYDSIMKIIQTEEIKYIKKNITIPAYHILIQVILNTAYNQDILAFDELSPLQKKYAAKFKKHPYTKYSNEVIWRFTNIKPGGDFFDFTLPDLNGKEYTLSEEIKGKYAFIDIWAPWCGPCIAKSREMKTLFEEYKNKGFTVIGIASKYQELSDVKSLLEKDKYQWITLIDRPELNSRINEHYGIEMAGGGCFLVDKIGKIVLVNPLVEEVKKVLETNL